MIIKYVVVESIASTANVAIMAPCHNYSPTDILVAQLGSTHSLHLEVTLDPFNYLKILTKINLHNF